MFRLDKLHHIVYTTAIALSVALLLNNGWWGLSVALGFGVLKELLWDWKLEKGHPDWLDMVANTVGLVFSWAILMRAGI